MNIIGTLPDTTEDKTLQAKQAQHLAEQHRLSPRLGQMEPFRKYLRELEALLTHVYQTFRQGSEEKPTRSYAAEWLLDNFYIVQQAFRQIREGLPPGYYRKLPKLDIEPPRYPRIYGIAREIVQNATTPLDIQKVRRFIRAYQRAAPLTMGELWALPLMLRLAALGVLGQALALLTDSKAPSPALITPPSDLREETLVANSIISLHTLANQDWKAFFENVSQVEEILRTDPAQVYAHMDFKTRDRYRGAVEALALQMGKDEVQVAREAIALARSAPRKKQADSSNRASHVGFYLVDTGCNLLESRLGYHVPFAGKLWRQLRSHPTLMYVGSAMGLTSILLMALLFYTQHVGGTVAQTLAAGLLGGIPAMTLSLTLLNHWITHSIPPRILPKMAFEKGLPGDCATMVVIPVLIKSKEEITSLLHQLELHYLGNIDPHLTFALLTDFADAPQPEMPGEAELLETLKQGIEQLNQKYRGESSPFYLFHREREWNAAEGCWMGWERKRGKLVEFNHLLTGGGRTSYTVKQGALEVLPRIRYVITLDADTTLPRDSARRLVATLAHPLNRAEFDPQTRAVVAGYTVLQPRVGITPTSANTSLFSQIFAGDTGIDLYTRAVSDIYQDLFGEGIYTGKGIYDVAAFEQSLEGRVPDNRLLSHDLFEGIHGRAGLVTDIVLYEDYPPHYLAYTRRLHRWVRGDWQLLPWLGPRVPQASGEHMKSTLSPLDRWKILDNLRRSLVQPTLLAFLIIGWLWLPGPAWVWTLIGVLTSGLPFLTQLISDITGYLKTYEAPALTSATRFGLFRWLLSLAFLPYEGSIMADAILTTLERMYISHKRMLQWTTAAHTIKLLGKTTHVKITLNLMLRSPLLAGIIALLCARLRPEALASAAPLLGGWVLAPWIAYALSHPLTTTPPVLSTEQHQLLRSLARRTWLYFEHFVGPDDAWLPPDHFQEDPKGMTSHSTSPTNMGLTILSTLAAYDLGYMSLFDLTLRMRPTFDTMGKLARYQGHFLNWYDTRTLEPLPPRYVSTVDSGNLAGALIAFQKGCHALPTTPILRWARFQGLIDIIDILIEYLTTDESTSTAPARDLLLKARSHIMEERPFPEHWAAMLQEFSQQIYPEMSNLLVKIIEAAPHDLDAGTLANLHVWVTRLHAHLHSLHDEIELLLPWLLSLASPPSLFTKTEGDPQLRDAWEALKQALPLTATLDSLSLVCKHGEERLADLQAYLDQSTSAGSSPLVQEALAWCKTLRNSLQSAPMTARALVIAYQDLSEQAGIYVQEMGFKFLLDPQRLIFHIGYNVEAEKLDEHYYDLLASEARLASLVAIARGNAPQSHWMHMHRPIAQINGRQGLLSWSGTMFEYLMPLLLIQNYPEALLGQSCLAAVERQIAYARQRGVPWGVSESAYYHFDAAQNYQYRAFGVPGLGLKRGLSEDLVIAPYASLLALEIAPQATLRNCTELIHEALLGRYGFYEAADYTQARLPVGQHKALVKSYYVHHQGMIMLSLANYLEDNRMVQRFHADPHIQSTELLLQEQAPERIPIEQAPAEEITTRRPESLMISFAAWNVKPDSPYPQVHTLSNGRYGLLITHTGGGYSWWKSFALTRWYADTTLDCWGNWIYIADPESGDLWSAGLQPTEAVPETCESIFSPYQAEFRRRDHGISTHMLVTLSPDEDIEIRQIALTNHTSAPRTLRVTSYGEVVLAPLLNDQRHPAFSKLFIESEYLPALNGLIFHRRSRSPEEHSPYLVHALVVEEDGTPTERYECDRAHFLGRGRTPRWPIAPCSKSWLSGTAGATLDPIMALGQEITLEPHTTTRLAFLTCVAESRKGAIDLTQRYGSWAILDQTFQRAHDLREVELHQLNFGPDDLEPTQKLLSALLYPNPALRAAPSIIAANTRGQSGLWPFGISGDYPILLVEIAGPEQLSLLQNVLRAHAFWRSQQLKIDLVILNEKESSYNQELQGAFYRLLVQMKADNWINQRGGIFLLRADQMRPEERGLLETVARVILHGDRGTLKEQLTTLEAPPVRLPAFPPILPHEAAPEPSLIQHPTDLCFDNGLGGFSADGKEYQIALTPGQWPPAPWINVIANPTFGFLVSESGGGYTWAENSGENRLTPWSNDPVSDSSGEACYLRDEETGEIWSPTPLPAGDAAPYLVQHGAGYSLFNHDSHGLKQQLRLFVDEDAPVKFIEVTLENMQQRPRRITATYYAEWVLGPDRQVNHLTLIPEFDPTTGALLARNPYNAEFGERVAFLAASQSIHGFTCDRAEFLGERGDMRSPAALKRIGLNSTFRPGMDPCAVLQLHINLNPGEQKTFHFLLGEGATREDSQRLIREYSQSEAAIRAGEQTTALWESLLSTLTVKTPDSHMDLLLNRWLLYQALSCRIWGRSALYQSSGAFGYRDQLQDVLALIYARPDLIREHILQAARYQFVEGDVLHWWHPPSGRGVRTRYTDDLLWLPYVTATYVQASGDTSLLYEIVPFLQGPLLEAEEAERYDLYSQAAEAAPLWEHCRRALKQGTTAGDHGLPLMGSGDWNDGMNRVGIKGEGESVWLGWFLYDTLSRTAWLFDRIGDGGQAAQYREQAKELQAALETNAWDGDWYLRAYYDDGTPLGSAKGKECQIDAIAQSWAVLSGGGSRPDRITQAMDAVSSQLIDPEGQLIRLFTPPFDKTMQDPGYIKGYPPGIRENGGQYTHAALWTVWAFAALGDGDRAVDLFELLNPITHADTPEKAAHYRVEPYVVAADVYSEPPHVGRGGWTWYTGSAGWMYRLGIEAILGLKLAGETFTLEPCIPRSWEHYEMTYHHEGSTYHIHVENPQGVNQGVVEMTLDGQPLPEKAIPLRKDKQEHQVHVIMGHAAGK